MKKGNHLPCVLYGDFGHKAGDEHKIKRIDFLIAFFFITNPNTRNSRVLHTLLQQAAILFAEVKIINSSNMPPYTLTLYTSVQLGNEYTYIHSVSLPHLLL